MKKQKIADWSSHIERLMAERELADCGAYTPAEIEKIDLRIRDARKQIIDALSVDELKELKKRDLRPEQAGEIVADEAPAAPSQELMKMAGAAHNAEFSRRTYYVAEKGFAPAFDPNRPISEAATGDTLEKLKLATAQPGAPRATIVDAYLNHLKRTPND